MIQVGGSTSERSYVNNTGRHSNGSRLYLLTSLVVILGCGVAFSQEPIQVAVNLVNVAFAVRDARGALVDDLGKEDLP